MVNWCYDLIGRVKLEWIKPSNCTWLWRKTPADALTYCALNMIQYHPITRGQASTKLHTISVVLFNLLAFSLTFSTKQWKLCAHCGLTQPDYFDLSKKFVELKLQNAASRITQCQWGSQPFHVIICICTELRLLIQMLPVRPSLLV